jgi:hypothetical protein
MLTRYWSWTSGPPQGGLPYGPLRYRAWTSGVADAAAAGLPFGPLRYRAWTSGTALVVIDHGGGTIIRIPVSQLDRLRLQRDDELLLFIAAAAVATGMLN